MKRRDFVAGMGAMLAAPLAGEAQQAGKVPRVGFLANSRSPGTEAFQRGLRELGYVEGRTSSWNGGWPRAD